MTDFKMPARPAVTMSDAAIKHFEQIANGKIVKFGVGGGGCAGFQYQWNLYDSKDEINDDDELTDYGAFIFAVDGASLMFLMGSSIDYLSDITGSHIEVINPLATAGCGCGESVSF